MHALSFTTALALGIASVNASFHVLFQETSIRDPQGGSDIDSNFLIGCASDNLSCDCYTGNGMITTSSTVDGSSTSPLPSEGFFSMDNNAGTGLCSSGRLDFFLRADGSGNWDAFQDGGDGTVVAECVPGGGIVDSCNGGINDFALGQTLAVTDALVCVSTFVCPQAA